MFMIVPPAARSRNRVPGVACPRLRVDGRGELILGD